MIDISKEGIDVEYYLDEARKTKEKIGCMLQLEEVQCDITDYNWIADMCDKVFEGERFDDAKYNSVI